MLNEMNEELQSNRIKEADWLLQYLDDQNVCYAYEPSFKVIDGELLDNRFLISFNKYALATK